MKHFDKQAKDWDNNPMKVKRAEIFAKEIVNFIKPNPTDTALEFGCGTGLLSYQLKDNFENITLADNSEGMIQVLEDKVKNLSLKNFKPLLVDLLEEDLDIGKFNVIYSLMTVHHIIDLEKVSKIFHSLLETNGYLCIADLVQEDGSFHKDHPDFDGHNGFDKKELSEILIRNGFKIEHYNISYIIEKELENGIRKYPLFLMICKKFNPANHMSFTLLSSPLQGFTDFKFRNAFNNYFGGIDTFYSPYIRLNGKLKIKHAYERDILPENNIGIEVIPQIITNDADEFLFVANYVQQFGYKELNWNLGCPYPMVTKCGMGSGLISQPEKINSILNKVHAESDIIVSMKMRLGYENSEEILKALPILDTYPIKNIAIHARLGKQLYKGGVDLDAFQQCVVNTKHKLYYNGDITSVAKFKEMQERFPTIDHWMIGRGIISDPFLPSMIKSNTLNYPDNKIELFSKFHDTLYQNYSESLSGPSHILLKMYHLWEYFATLFSNPRKTLKKIKKANNIRNYETAVKEILATEFSI